MYIKTIRIQNYGPLEDLSIECPFDDNNNPQPVIFVGTNGSGKTSLLANIVDAFVEVKRAKFPSLNEVSDGKFFKVGQKDFIFNKQNYSYVNITFSYETFSASYVDFCHSMPESNFLSFDLTPFEGINKTDILLKSEGYYKKTNAQPNFLKSFEKNILLYFPVSRYEIPAWWNEEHELGLHLKKKYVGLSDTNFIKESIVKETEEWILNIILDAELYENKPIPLTAALNLDSETLKSLEENSKSAQVATFNEMLAIAVIPSKVGKNTSLRTTINQLLTTLYQAKDLNVKSVRLGVSTKVTRHISIIKTMSDNTEEITAAPTISHLSSGELMVFSLFCSILKEYDQLNLGNTVNLEEISGVVIIDEIDLHLHIDLQKNLLPKLIQTFPKIQFIITTHSPLFLLGMEDIYKDLNAINLPEGIPIPLSEFSEVEKSYSLFAESLSEYKANFQVIQEKINKIETPLIITEGKTDWKHLKAALTRFKADGEFTDLDIDFLEYEESLKMGDNELNKMCNQFSHLSHHNKIICIFDRDVLKIIEKFPDPYQALGNKVFAFCIPEPSHRKKYKNISIEFLYLDKDIKTQDKDGKRLLFSNEVEKNIKKNLTTRTDTISVTKLNNTKEEDEYIKKIYDDKVSEIVDTDGKKVAFSKNCFAQNILERKEGLGQLNIDAFRPIFETIARIIDDSQETHNSE